MSLGMRETATTLEKGKVALGVEYQWPADVVPIDKVCVFISHNTMWEFTKKRLARAIKLGVLFGFLAFMQLLVDLGLIEAIKCLLRGCG